MNMIDIFQESGIHVEVINDKEYIFTQSNLYINQNNQMVISLDLNSIETESIVDTILISIKDILNASSPKEIYTKYTEKLIKQFKKKKR